MKNKRRLLGVVSPPANVLGQGLLAGMQFAAEGTFVLLLLEGGVAGVLLPVDAQVGLGGVALQTDVALERLLSRVHSGVTLILTLKIQIICKCYTRLEQKLTPISFLYSSSHIL